MNRGAPQLIGAGPPKQVNVTIDPAVADAMKAAQAQFNAPADQENDCLKNARASSWLDIQAHYYCQLPYDAVRMCYSTKLVEGASSADPRVNAMAAVNAYNTCFSPPASGAPDQRTPQAKWIHENQEAVFKYIMFTKQGMFDFELGSENAAINKFYKDTNATRPRRITDTFPAWLANQPRYDAIRTQQVDAQKKAQQGAAGSDGGV